MEMLLLRLRDSSARRMLARTPAMRSGESSFDPSD